jgi:hypothetical protein
MVPLLLFIPFFFITPATTVVLWGGEGVIRLTRATFQADWTSVFSSRMALTRCGVKTSINLGGGGLFWMTAQIVDRLRHQLLHFVAGVIPSLGKCQA